MDDEDDILPQDDIVDQGAESAATDDEGQGQASPPPPRASAPVPDFIPLDQAFKQEAPPDFIPLDEAMKTPSGAPQGAVGRDQLGNDVPEFIPLNQVKDTDITDKTDRGILSNFLRNLTRELVLQGWSTDVMKGAGRLLNPDAPKDNFLYKTGENLQRGIDYLLPQSSTEAGSIAGGIGKGLGDIAPIIAATLMGATPAIALGGVQMGTGGTETMGARAEAKGATPEERVTSERLGAGVGAGAGTALALGGGMLLPALERTAPGLANWMTTLLKNAGREGAVFAGVGEAQEYLNDKIAQAYFDPNSEYHFDLKRLVTEFGTGALLGAGKQIVSGGYRPGKERAKDEPGVQEDMTTAAASEPTKTGVGNAQAQPRPTERPETTGNPDSAPTRSERQYQKRLANMPKEEGSIELAPGEVAPDLAAALQKETPPQVAPEPTGAPAAPSGPTPVGAPEAHVGQRPAPQGQPEPPPFQSMPEPRPRMMPPIAEQHALDVARAETEGVQRAQQAPRQGQMGEAFAPEQVRTDREQSSHNQLPPSRELAEPTTNGSRTNRAPRILEDLTAQRGPLAREVAQQHMPAYDLGRAGKPLPKGANEAEQAAHDRGGNDKMTAERGETQPVETKAPIDRAIELAKANNLSQKMMAVLTKARENPKLADVVAKRFLAEYTRQEGAKARATPEVRALDAGERERSTANATETPPPAAPARPKKAPGAYPVVDATGRTVGHAKSEALARTRSNMLKIAKDVMDRHPFPDIDPANMEQVKGLREKAKAALTDAEAEGYKTYLPREKKTTEGGEQKAHLEAPPHALWLAEVKAFALGKRKAEDFVTREKLLRAGDEQSADIVREDRFTEGDARMRRTPEVTAEGNLAPKKNIDAMGEPEDRTRPGGVFTTFNGERYRVDESVRESAPLRDRLKPDESIFIGGKFAPGYSAIAREVLAQDPNVRVHTIDPTHMDLIGRMNGFRALEAYYDPNEHAIFLKPGAKPEVILHEAIHAATTRRLKANPQLEEKFNKLMDIVRPELDGLHRYAMSSVNEFMTHAMSNPAFQDALSHIHVTPVLAKELGLGARIRTGFQAFVDMVRQIVGIPDGHFSALEAAIKLTHNVMEAETKPPFGKRQSIDGAVQQVRDQADGLLRQLKGAVLLKIRDTDKIAHSADRIFGGADNNPIRKIADRIEMARMTGLKLSHEDAPMLDEGLKLRRADPAEFHNLETLLQDESQYQRYGDFPLNRQGFNTKGINEEWRNAHHPDLEARWNALPEDLKDYRATLYDYYKEQHDRVAEETAGNRLSKELGLDDKPLAKRVMDGTLSSADFQRLGPDDRLRQARMELIQEAGTISALKGPYSPFIRRGRYAVTGEFKTPGEDTALRRIDDRTFEFDNKQAAIDFAKQQHGTPFINSYYADMTTGERTSKVRSPVEREGVQQQEPQSGRPLEYDKEIPLSKNDPNTQQRWEVRVEKGYLRMFDTRAEALAHEAELSRSGVMERTDSQPKKYQPHTDAVTLASNLTNLEKKLKDNPLYENMTGKQKETVKQLLAEHYLQMLAATRVHSSRLHRNNVRGADDDILRNTMDYSQETAIRRARLEHQPALDEAREVAENMVNQDNVHSHARRAILNEIDSRLNAMKGEGFRLASGQMGPGLQRLMSLSYTARLATPGFTIRNLTQPGLFLGEIAGKHGWGASFRELGRAYRDIGTGTVLVQGAKDTGRAAVGKLTHPETLLADILSRPRVTADDKYAIDYMVKRGRIDPDAGFQMGETIRNPEGIKLDFFGARRQNALMRGTERGVNALDNGLHWIEEVSRQMPRAAETINRVSMGLTAFRMEMRRNGGDREAAARFADDAVRNTQFIYSDTNKPTWQRNPFARAAFQFKQFGKSTYEFMGRHMATSIDRQATPQERRASRQALGGLFITHTLVAGALGLPWEPVRALLIGAKQAGWTNKEWDDVENGIREALTGFGNLVGLNEKNAKKLGEAISRGLPRLAGIDLSPGLGLDNMLLFGSPRSGTDREMDNNLSGWLFNMIAGAPTALQIQMLSGMRDLIHGEYAKGIEKLMPMKIAGDVIKAEEGYRHGKINARGRETQPPYSAYEAGVKAMGLPVGSEAERNAYQHQVYQQGTEQRQEKSKLIANWLSADGAGKDKAAQKAFDAGITGRELTQALQRERSADKRVINGVITTKPTRPIAERLNKVYNFDDF